MAGGDVVQDGGAARSVDVAIIGYGPVGATAANLLGALGLDVVVIEPDPSPYPRARAISTDDEVLRIWQQAGLAERLKRDMLGDRPIEFVDWDGRAFMNWAPRRRGNGHPTQMFIYQPALEEVLREGVDRFARVEVLLEREMRDLRQTDDAVELSVRSLRAETTSIVRAKYVIACDGGSSPTRALLDVGFEGRTYEDPWLVIDTKVRQEWPGVDRLRFHCDPERPAVDCPTPLGHHRWEFPVLDGEKGSELSSEESVWRLLGRYGVTPQHVDILRRAVYVHHVRRAERWRDRRVFLMGDAAHVMPPWIGQGMASGVRDAGNLCWKLAAVIRGTANDEILDSYEVERQPQVRDTTRRSVVAGRIINEKHRSLAILRNRVLATAMRAPWLGDFIREARFLPKTALKEGLLAHRKARARGRLVPQPSVADAGHERVMLDDLLGFDWALIARAGACGTTSGAAEQWRAAGARVFELTDGAEPGEGELRDLDGVLEEWMDNHGADAVVVRPDRVVFAMGDKRHPLPAPPTVVHP